MDKDTKKVMKAFTFWVCLYFALAIGLEVLLINIKISQVLIIIVGIILLLQIVFIVALLICIRNNLHNG